MQTRGTIDIGQVVPFNQNIYMSPTVDNVELSLSNDISFILLPFPHPQVAQRSFLRVTFMASELDIRIVSDLEAIDATINDSMTEKVVDLYSTAIGACYLQDTPTSAFAQMKPISQSDRVAIPDTVTMELGLLLEETSAFALLALKEYEFNGFQILRSEGGPQLTKSAKKRGRERRKQAEKAAVDATSKLFFQIPSCISIGIDLLDHAGGTSNPDLSPSVPIEPVCTLYALRGFHLISNLGSPRRSCKLGVQRLTRL